jgi:DNA-binding CsgD family transcriptional regulator
MANPASGWSLKRVTAKGAVWERRMRASNSQQETAFNPKPLTIEQENAIDLLLTGKSDREVAETIGVHRMTVQTWRTSHPLFVASLAQRREALFSGAVDRLRSLVSKAIDNIEKEIDVLGDAKTPFELLKVVGLYGFCPPTGEMDVQKIFDDMVMRQLAQVKIPDKFDHLIDPLRNPEKERRRAEIEAELMAEFGEDGPSRV